MIDILIGMLYVFGILIISDRTTFTKQDVRVESVLILIWPIFGIVAVCILFGQLLYGEVLIKDVEKKGE